MQNAAHYGLGGGMGSMGMAGHGGFIGGGNAGFPFIPPAPAPAPGIYRDAKEDLLRDLMRRITRHAGKIAGEDLVQTIHEHSGLVKKLLEDFLEGAAYLQAQVPMVEAAFKSNPTLAQSVVNSLNRAYTELCAQYFGDET